MMVMALVVIVGLILAFLMIYGEEIEKRQYEKDRDTLYGNQYTEDIDFSLAVKGYPVVNDHDIGHTQWKADRALA